MFREPRITVSSNGIGQMMDIEDFLFHARKIWIQGTLTPDTADSIMTQLKLLEEEAGEKAPDTEVTVYINSCGGDVYGGLNLYHYMINSPLYIRTVVTGSACSIAAIVFLGGDERCMMPYSRVLIHEPGKSNISSRPSIEEMDRITADLHYYKKCTIDIVSERTRLTKKQVEKMITSRNQLFHPQEALENGFVTAIVDGL